MIRKPSVFITGLGALTASGMNVEDTWQAIINGQSGIEEIKNYDIAGWPARLAGELKAFNPRKMLPDRKLFKVISKQDVMGINAAMQAIEHSGILDYRDGLSDSSEFNDQTGVYVGSPGNKYFQQYDFLPLLAKSGDDMPTFAEKLFSEVHPMWLLRILPNNVLAYTGISFGFKGPNHNIANHAVSGIQAIIEACHAIQNGQIERAVVVAYDVAVEPQSIFYYDKLGVLSRSDIKPFDQQHDGTILADGAAAMVLESENSVRQRQAKCYGEILGGSSSTEGTGLFGIEENGTPLSQLMQQTLQQLQLSADDIGLVTAHANANPISDISESKALNKILPPSVPVTGFKWSYGHSLCASGLLDSVFTAYALKQNVAPGIANLNAPAKDCQALNIQSEHRSLSDPKHALIINRGFGSMNACLVMKPCD